MSFNFKGLFPFNMGYATSGFPNSESPFGLATWEEAHDWYWNIQQVSVEMSMSYTRTRTGSGGTGVGGIQTTVDAMNYDGTNTYDIFSPPRYAAQRLAPAVTLRSLATLTPNTTVLTSTTASPAGSATEAIDIDLLPFFFYPDPVLVKCDGNYFLKFGFGSSSFDVDDGEFSIFTPFTPGFTVIPPEPAHGGIPAFPGGTIGYTPAGVIGTLTVGSASTNIYGYAGTYVRGSLDDPLLGGTNVFTLDLTVSPIRA